MQPLGDNIVFEEVEINHTAPGGKVLVVASGRRDDEDGSKLTAGKCIAYGPGQWDASGTQWIAPGSRVGKDRFFLLNKTGNYSYQIGMKKYLLCRTVNVVAELDASEVKING